MLAFAACGGGGASPARDRPGVLPASEGNKTQATGTAPTLTLWVTDNGGIANFGSLYAFSVSTASTTATLVPKSEFSEYRPGINGNRAGIADPEKIVFDRAGRLWVVNLASDLLVSFTIHAPGVTPTLEAASGIMSPFAFGTSPYDRYSGPGLLAYDRVTDSVWTLAEFQALQRFSLSTAGIPTAVPTTVMAADPNTTGRMDDISFDRAGVLWASNRNLPGSTAFAITGGSVKEVAGSEFTTVGGTPFFDASDNLWIADNLYNSRTSAPNPPIVHEYTNPGTTGTQPKQMRSFAVAAAASGTDRRVTPIGFDPQGNLWLETTDQVSGSGDRSFGLLAYDVSQSTPALLTTIPLPAPNVQYYGLAFQP